MSVSKITVERMDKAVDYLASTDEECARARSMWARAEYKAKSIRDTIFSSIKDGSVADRQAIANIDPRHDAAKEEEFKWFFKYESIKNKRNTEQTVSDSWRSLNAGRNKGQII